METNGVVEDVKHIEDTRTHGCGPLLMSSDQRLFETFRKSHNFGTSLQELNNPFIESFFEFLTISVSCHDFVVESERFCSTETLLQFPFSKMRDELSRQFRAQFIAGVTTPSKRPPEIHAKMSRASGR
jgi:hypothetical protein